MIKTFSSQIYEKTIKEGTRQKKEQIINEPFY